MLQEEEFQQPASLCQEMQMQNVFFLCILNIIYFTKLAIFSHLIPSWSI